MPTRTSIVELDKSRYLIVRYADDTTKVFDVAEDQEVDAHPKLRETNEAYGLGIALMHDSGWPKNTRSLGRLVLNELKKRNLGFRPDDAPNA
jgi:hypothetical protein